MGSRLVLGAGIDPRIKIAGRIEMPKRPRRPYAHPVQGAPGPKVHPVPGLV